MDDCGWRYPEGFDHMELSVGFEPTTWGLQIPTFLLSYGCSLGSEGVNEN